MYALIDISNQMLEDSAFDHAGASLRKAGLAVAINEMPALKLMQVFSILRCLYGVLLYADGDDSTVGERSPEAFLGAARNSPDLYLLRSASRRPSASLIRRSHTFATSACNGSASFGGLECDVVMRAPPPFVSVYGLPSQRLSKIEPGRARPRRARLFCCTG